MTAEPLLAPPDRHLGQRIVRRAVGLALRTTLIFSPRPTVVLVRRAFAAGGTTTAQKLVPFDPDGVESVVDERYGDGPNALLDVHRPATSTHAVPIVVWVHGGGWIGGAKEELATYLRLVAQDGYGVVAPRYGLAPESRYPTPLRDVTAAVDQVLADAERLRLDPSRVVLAGDSAGAQIAAQVAALVTTPGYADAVGVVPALEPAHLRGVVLACGAFDLRLLRDAGTPTARRLVHAALWAYSGRRDHGDDPTFALASVVDHVTPSFPPALITVGNADPLRPHSELLAERLRGEGRTPETLFFEPDHAPLGHEYQFDLTTDAGQLFLERLRAFLSRVTSGGNART